MDRLREFTGHAQIAFVWLAAVAVATVIYFLPVARLLDSLAVAAE